MCNHDWEIRRTVLERARLECDVRYGMARSKVTDSLCACIDRKKGDPRYSQRSFICLGCATDRPPYPSGAPRHVMQAESIMHVLSSTCSTVPTRVSRHRQEVVRPGSLSMPISMTAVASPFHRSSRMHKSPIALVAAIAFLAACSDSPTTPSKVSNLAGPSRLLGNGFPSGGHDYHLNIIGVPKDKNVAMDNSDGHRIFVRLQSTNVVTAPGGKNNQLANQFGVIDANATDGDGAIFGVPDPCADDNLSSTACRPGYSVWARTHGSRTAARHSRPALPTPSPPPATRGAAATASRSTHGASLLLSQLTDRR